MRGILYISKVENTVESAEKSHPSSTIADGKSITQKNK